MPVIFAIAVLSGLMIAWPVSAQTPSERGAKEPPGLTLGANSFAEGQARALIESKGYDNVSALVNDSKGVWHGTATKGQAKVHVSVDYKGNVDAK
jgi:hypothetical protein